jgi:hypothetical protein
VEEGAQEGGYGASSREHVSRRLFPCQPKNAVSRPTGTAEQRKADTADRHGDSTIPDENDRAGESQGEAGHLPRAQAKEADQGAKHYDHDRPQVRDEIGLSRRNAVGSQDERVAHSGMAKAPIQVQVFGERLRRLTDGGLSSPNHSVVLDMCLDSYCVKPRSPRSIAL